MTEQQTLRSDTSDSLQSADEVWRNEIQARVARYRTRRGRRIEGTYSMRFPFGSDQPQSDSPVDDTRIDDLPREEFAAAPDAIDVSKDEEISLQAAAELAPAGLIEAPDVSLATEAEPEFMGAAAVEAEPPVHDDSAFSLEADFEPLPPPVPRPPAKRKVIAFPRQPSNQDELYRLADPVVPEQPRILDVPEELEPFPTTPLLENLQLPAAQQSSAPSPDHIDLPFQAASISRRLSAGLLDFAIVAGASAVLGAVAYKLLPKLQPSKPLVLAAATVPVVLWAAYQYLFLMYSRTTAGMQLMKLRLSTFEGGVPDRRHRRRRVFGLYFSSASLLMGLLWSLADVDALCWHDRISHTYVTRRD